MGCVSRAFGVCPGGFKQSLAESLLNSTWLSFDYTFFFAKCIGHHHKKLELLKNLYYDPKGHSDMSDHILVYPVVL